MERIWGFDLGTTSVGFCVLDLDESKEVGGIERMGVRIFPEGVTEDKKEPRNQARREARLRRRQLRRRRERKKELSRLLAEAGLLPEFDSASWREVMARDPYDQRTGGLSGPLAPYEIGRALYHLAQRRGFASSRHVEEPVSAKEKGNAIDISKVNLIRFRQGDACCRSSAKTYDLWRLY